MAGNANSGHFYVYRIFNGPTTVYVGKGTGARLQTQQRRFGLPGEIIERCASDDEAFFRERVWIAALHPTDNKAAGGNGGRSRKLDPRLKSEAYRPDAMDIELAVYGTKYVIAKNLLRFVNEANCEALGVPVENISAFRAFVATAKPLGLQNASS